MTKSIADFLGDLESPRTSVDLTARADLLAEHAQVSRDIARSARDSITGGGTETVELRRRLAQLEADMAASSFTITFRALRRQEYARLLAEHPPREQDRAEGFGFNMETFPVALIGECSVDPEMTAEEAEELCERLSDGQFSKLWNHAFGVNVLGNDSAPKSVGLFALAATNETSSTTAAPEGSLAQSSSDG